MKSDVSRVALSMAVILAIASVACGASGACDGDAQCIPRNVSFLVPASLANPSNQVALSGAACQGVTAKCAQDSTGGCLWFTFLPIASGNCHVDVFLRDHTFTRDITIKNLTGGCCPGLYAQPTGDIQVTSLQ